MGTYEELWDSEMCQVCTNRNDELITLEDARNDNVRLMSSSDWAALLLASIIIACGIYAELRDQMLCEFMLAAALQRSTGKGTIPRLLVSILGILRLFAFLPSMLTVVVNLVLLHGGTALQICLNSVAVVFLVELDNMAFTYMLNEDLRKEAEEFAHTPVTASDRKVIDAMKWYYCSTIPFFIVGGVYLGTSPTDMGLVYYLSSGLLFGVGSIVQSVYVAKSTGKFNFKAACRSLGYCIGGWLFSMINMYFMEMQRFLM